MKAIYNTYRPNGFSTVNSYLFSEDPVLLINFFKNAFYADELDRTINEKNNEIGNCILKIGDSCLMISQARKPFNNMRTAHYLFVDDVDYIYQRALENGAVNEFAPTDMDYNDRQAGIIDPSGNYWWISKRLVKNDYQDD